MGYQLIRLFFLASQARKNPSNHVQPQVLPLCPCAFVFLISVVTTALGLVYFGYHSKNNNRNKSHSDRSTCKDILHSLLLASLHICQAPSFRIPNP